MYQEQLFTLNRKFKQEEVRRSPNETILQSLHEQIDKTEQMMEEYRTKAKAEARERLAKVPNEALQAALVEYEVRAKYLTEKKTELAKSLRDAQSEIEEGAILDPELEMLQQDIDMQRELVAALNRQLLRRTHGVEFGVDDEAGMGATDESPFAPVADDDAEIGGDPFSFGGEAPFASSEDRGDALELRINADGSALLDGVPVTIDQLKERLANRPRPVGRVQVSMDQSLHYQTAIAWIDAVRAAGVKAVSVDTRADEVEKADVDGTEPKAIARLPEVQEAYDLGMTAMKKGKLIEALAQFAVAIRLDASFAEAHLYKGHVLRIRSEYTDAVAAFSQALDINPKLAAAYNGRGECYLAMTPPDYNLALTDLTKAVDLDPRNEQARVTRDRIRATGGAGMGATDGSPSPGSSLTGRGSSEPYRLGPGDSLSVRAIGVIPDSPIDGAFFVEEEGTLALGPWYGRVEVAGLTVREAEAAVQKQLTETLKDMIKDTPRVQVTLLKKAEHDDAVPKLRRGADGLWRSLDPYHPSSDDETGTTGEERKWEHYVPFPEGMGDAEAQWVVEALERLGIGAAAEQNGGKLILRIVTRAPLHAFKVVWESHMVGDRVQRMCRFVGADGVDVLPSPFGNPTTDAPLTQLDLDDAEARRASNKLKAGDTIVVRVLGAFAESPIDDAFVIEDEGTIALGPTYGRVAVVGLTVLEAENAITKHLKTILTNAQVQVTRQRQTPTPGDLPRYDSAGSDEPATFLYDGKTFDQWRSLWRTELKVEKRTEAIEALAAFARAGYGREAVEALFDVAGEYDFSRIDESAEGRLKLRVLELLTTQASRIEPKVWLPALMERLTADNAKWRVFTEWVLGESYLRKVEIDAEARALLVQMASDDRYGSNTNYLLALLSSQTGDDPEVDAMVRAVFTGEGKDNALALLRGWRFQDLDRHPEQLELLFDDDESVRRQARTILSRMNPSMRPNESAALSAVATKLLEVLDDPSRAADHANAIRALAAIGEYLARNANSPARESAVQRLETVVAEGDDSLLLPAYVALRRLQSADSLKKIAESLSEERRRQWSLAVKGAWRAEEEHLFEPQPEKGGRGGGMAGGQGGGFF